MAFLEQIVNLQKDNLQLIKDSVVKDKSAPKCLMALQSQPVAPLQGLVHERLALTPAPDPNRDVNLGESCGSASLGGPRQQASFGVSSLSVGRQSQEASLAVPRLAIASGAAFPAETLQSQDTQPAEALLQVAPAPSPAPAATTAAIASGEEALLQIVPVPSTAPAATTAAIASGAEALLQLVPVPSPAPAATTAAIAAGAAFPAETLQSQGTQEGDKLAAAALQIVPVPSTAPAASTALATAASTALAATSSAESCLAQKILRDMGVMNDAKAAVKKGPGGSAAPRRRLKRKAAAPKAQAAIEDTGVPNEEAIAAPKRKAAPKAQAAIADAGEPSQEAIAAPKKKLARVDHEASRSSWRVRFPDGTSKGFKYKEGEAPAAMRKQAEDYAIRCGFKIVE